MKRFLPFALALFVASSAFGQVLTTVSSGTITNGGTFQLVFAGKCPNGVQDATGCPAQPTFRTGCTIVNNATTNMFVWPNPNPVANATDAKSVLLTPGTAFNCQLVNDKVIQDPIYIDGTTAAAFYAGLQ